jgi:protease I
MEYLYKRLIMIITVFMVIQVSNYSQAAPFVPLTDDLLPAATDYRLVQPAVENRHQFAGKQVAILASHGVEEEEIQFPYQYLVSRGAQVDILVPWWTPHGVVTSKFVKNTGFALAQGTFRTSKDYDLIIITGGAWNGQVEVSDPDLRNLVYRHYQVHKRPLAAICKGTEVLIHIKNYSIEGKEDLNGPSIFKGTKVIGPDYERANLKNAGLIYVDGAKSILSGNLLTGIDPTGLVEFVQQFPILLDATAK